MFCHIDNTDTLISSLDISFYGVTYKKASYSAQIMDQMLFVHSKLVHMPKVYLSKLPGIPAPPHPHSSTTVN